MEQLAVCMGWLLDSDMLQCRSCIKADCAEHRDASLRYAHGWIFFQGREAQRPLNRPTAIIGYAGIPQSQDTPHLERTWDALVIGSLTGKPLKPGRMILHAGTHCMRRVPHAYGCTVVFARIESVMLRRQLWKGLARATERTEFPTEVPSLIDSFLEEHVILAKKFDAMPGFPNSDIVSARGGVTKKDISDLHAQVKGWLSGSEEHLQCRLGGRAHHFYWKDAQNKQVVCRRRHGIL